MQKTNLPTYNLQKLQKDQTFLKVKYVVLITARCYPYSTKEILCIIMKTKYIAARLLRMVHHIINELLECFNDVG